MLIFFIKKPFQQVLKMFKIGKSSDTDVGVLFNEAVIG